MKTLKNNWKKIIPIVITCAIIDIIVHALWAPLYDYDFPPSFFVKNGLFESVAVIFLIIIYTALAIVFAFIQENLPGSKLLKGFRFGISFGVLWFVAMPGVSIIFGSPLNHELLTGALDGLVLILLGLLLGKFIATDSSDITDRKSKTNILSVISIALFFMIGQYIAFIPVNKSIPYFDIKKIDFFLWSLVLGTWIGIMYLLLKQGIRKYTLIKRALWFGVVIFGIDWLFYNIFMILIVDTSLLEVFHVAGNNVLSVVLWVLFVERFIKNIN